MAKRAEPPTTRLVWNPLAGTYVAQSPARMRRREGTRECPFCADRASGRVAPDAQTWIRPNDFPALVPPTGECYVLVYSPQHARTFAEFTPDEAVGVIQLWQRMYQQLAPQYPCVMTWETSGEVIGQTQHHPHGQTYGVSFLPDTLAREMSSITSAAERGQPCPFCVEAATEDAGPRRLLSGTHWVAFVPAYARYPYQAHILPRRHLSSVGALGQIDDEPAALRELATFLLAILRAYRRLYEAPMPYMLALHQLGDERFHFHIELLPVGRAPGKLKLAASTESAWGLWLNDSLPEHAAAELRALLSVEKEVRP